MITLAALPDAVIRSLEAHAEAEYPQECCGVVLQGPDGPVALAAMNVAKDPRHGFAIAPGELYKIAKRIYRGEKLLAIYHSHVDTPALFSETDKRFARPYPDVLHIVLATTARGVIARHAYRFDGVQVDEPVMA